METIKCVGTDIHNINAEYYLCIVDYFIKFTVVKMIQSLATDHLMHSCKIIFSEYVLPLKLYLMQEQNLSQTN